MSRPGVLGALPVAWGGTWCAGIMQLALAADGAAHRCGVAKRLLPSVTLGHIKKSQVIVKQDKLYFRPNEVHDLVGNYSKAKKILKWKPLINFDALITEMIDSEIKNY